MASAQILCTRCGAASPEARDACAKCAGKNARVCGACGNQNSVVKNFCDKCGRPIGDLGPVVPPARTVLPGSPAASIPATMIRRALEPAPPSAPSLDDLWVAPVADETIERPRANALRRALNVFAAFVGVAGAAYGIWYWSESRRPEILVPKLAAEYLHALRTHDEPKAYAMLSSTAKRYCTQDEFRASRDKTAWTWSNVRIVRQEPGAVLLAYDLQPSGAAPRIDHLLFTLEDGHWTRPYNRTLMRQAEEAFNRNDPEKGLSLAVAAGTVDPRDPTAWGYLCEGAYYRKSPVSAATSCEKALELAQTYPSNLSSKSLYHLHSILADIYRHALGKPALALDQFAQMLAFADISPADQCQILMARAQTYSEISRPGEALADLDRGLKLCTDPQDLAYIRQFRQTLNAPE